MLGKDESHHNISSAQGAGGVICSLQDLAKWARALYTGRVLPRKQQHELESLVSSNPPTGKPISRTTPGDPVGYGLGVFQGTAPAFGGTNWYYSGGNLGFNVLHVYLPGSGTIITLGFNSIPDIALDPGRSELAASIYHILHRARLA